MRAGAQRTLVRLERISARGLAIRSGDPLAREFASFGAGSEIAWPRIALQGPGAVAIGERVTIRSQVCIEALAPAGKVILSIGDNALVGHYARFVAINGIEIEADCGIGHGSTLADTIHDWPQIFAGVPAAETPLLTGGPLRIRQGAWIGNNCNVLGGITIGARAIVAPNSVVTRDVPEQVMVSGNPARRVPIPG